MRINGDLDYLNQLLSRGSPSLADTRLARSLLPPGPVTATMSHQIPFRQPVITVPLSWAFAGPSTSQSIYHQALPTLATRKDTPFNILTPPCSQSRKRSASDEFDSEAPTPGSHSKSFAGLPKRTKRSIVNPSSFRPSSQPELQNLHGLGPEEDQIDLGTALVSLTKNELVTLLHGLIQQKPDLKPTIQGLLPPPTLESILIKLAEVENQLVQSIPNKRTNREEYVWNRVRVPLTSYVNDCLNGLEISSKTIERRCSSQDGKIELSAIYGAVSDQLTLLSQLSLSISRVESLLPCLSVQPLNEDPDQDLNWNVSYPFQSILIPSLFQNWKTFIETIHKLIFIDRMILSESLMRKWFNLLDELSSPHHSLNHHQTLFPNRVPDSASPEENHTVQRLMIAIRDEAHNRFGCLVGLKG